MLPDEQQLVDLLGNVPLQLRQFTNGVADYIDNNVDRAADLVRGSLSCAPWLPASLRPSPPARAAIPNVVSLSTWDSAHDWVSRNKLLTGVILVVCGTVVFKGYQKSMSIRKPRRAKRAKNGGRTEVVVIAGSPTLPLTKSLALDMERRGFIVYIVCDADDDEKMVKSLGRQDITSLKIDTTNPPSAGLAMEKFADYLHSPHAPGPQIKPNRLTLTSVLLIPSLHYRTSPIATIPPSSFADLFNTHLLHPILTIQSFLPLLTSRLQPIGEKWVPPKVLVFTPTIISSINPPFHAPEATVCSALSAFTEVLTAELRPLDIPVTHMQLGTFDFAGFISARDLVIGQGQHTSGQPQETLVWPDGAKHVYARNFVAQTSSAISGARIRGFKGSSLRRLHHSVFDVMDGSIASDTVRIGLGSSVYGFVGRWAPRGLVSWLMGIRRVDELSTWKTSEADLSQSPSEDDVTSNNEFIAVPSEINAWSSEEKDGGI